MPPRRLWLAVTIVLAAALAVWGAARSVEAQRVRSELDKAKQELAAGLYPKAWRRLTELARSHPADGEIAYQLGRCERFRGRNSAALEAWERVSPGTTFFTKAVAERAILAIDLGQYTRAEEILQASLLRAPRLDRNELLTVLETLYRMEGRIDEARQAVLDQWAHSDSPASLVKDLYWLDTTYLPLEKMRTILEKAAADDDRVWLGRANLAIRTGRFDEAATWLGDCLKRRPDDPGIWRARLELARATADLGAAWQALDHLGAGGVSPEESLRLRSWIAARLDDASAEQKALLELSELVPGDTAALDRLAEFAVRAGALGDAARLRRRAAELGAVKDRYRTLM